ncbi:MAG: hypothetical protein A3D24_02765 [Candidatus Blackburnbacteria bacterium RIFCSPHIGHO2_02_FULL_39_13]|nr:MAG: hypothetical protein A2694_01670 [Candidatus Blackburnbacteria bacterium RIFCSPHIGHO2_01_FULL_40_17]OGY07747.1 MAG: hypothetical protein A3D24_02765 [Candidatus Blackburnbacteria bacterium RIFCSPHIGHO2_02_FULL_39_13]
MGDFFARIKQGWLPRLSHLLTITASGVVAGGILGNNLTMPLLLASFLVLLAIFVEVSQINQKMKS